MNSFYRAVLALLPLTAGCAVGPGDYVIYRVAFADAVSSEDCFPGGQDPDDANDTSTFRAGQTFAIYRSGESHFLEFGNDVLEGSKGDGVFTFTGTSVDIEYFGNNDSSSTTTTNTATVTIDPAGASVLGTAVQTSSQTCSGSDCTGFDAYSCTGTSSFVGTRVNGVDLEYVL